MNFGQEVECLHDGRNFLEWHSHSWLLDQATGEKVRPLATELGFWRPGEDGKEVEFLLAHPTGIVEMYYGTMESARVTVRTDSVVRSPQAKEYNAGSGCTDWSSRSCSGSWTWQRWDRSCRATCPPS